MIMAIDASTVEAMIPYAGTPEADSFLNCSGNSPSSAAALGISAQIIVHPFSAPNPETMTARAIRLPAQVPPNMELAAVENGSLVFDRTVAGRTPKITVRDSM